MGDAPWVLRLAERELAMQRRRHALVSHVLKDTGSAGSGTAGPS